MRKPSEAEPVDPRSTQRKRARKLMFAERVPYICGAPSFRSDGNFCGRSPIREKLPPDCPQDIDLAPEWKQFASVTLQCNHINKNIMDNDAVNREWLCPSCHKLEDSKTEKGVSQIKDDPYGYEL